MYSFVSICVFLFLVCAMIFGKNIKSKQFLVYCIVLIGSLIGTTITNGILSKDIPYSKVLNDEEEVNIFYTSYRVDNKDTIYFKNTPIEYIYIKDTLNKVVENTIYLHYDNNFFNYQNCKKLKIYLSNDTISKIKEYKFRKNIDSRWITSFGLPSRGDKFYEVYLPNNESNKQLYNFINNNFKFDEKI